MKYLAEMHYGDKDRPWKPNILTVLGALILFPFSLVMGFIIMGLIIVYNFMLMDSHHIEFKVMPRKILMPDGSVRDPEA